MPKNIFSKVLLNSNNKLIKTKRLNLTTQPFFEINIDIF